LYFFLEAGIGLWISAHGSTRVAALGKGMRDQPTEPYIVFYVGCVTLLTLRGAPWLWRINPRAALPYHCSSAFSR